MGLRSYLFAESGQGWEQLLEANNSIPLLWLATVPLDAIDHRLDGVGPSLRLTNGESAGITLGSAEALEQLARRRASLLPWLVDDGTLIFDAFAGFLSAQNAQQFRIDLAEWVDAANSEDEARDELRAMLEALDTAPPKTLPPKRRPKQIKWLMEHTGLADAVKDPSRYANLLGGFSEGVAEPWRREKPRPRRLPDDRLYWSNSDPVVSRDGGTIVVMVKNELHLESPLIWRRATGLSVAMPVDAALEHVHVHLVSGDSRVVFGTCVRHPGAVDMIFGYDGERFLTYADDKLPSVVVAGCSDDGAVVAGTRSSGDYYDDSARAFLWRPGSGAVDLLGLDVKSDASKRPTAPSMIS